MKIYWNSFLSLLFPPLCENCNTVLLQSEQLLCLRCILDLPRTNYHKLSPNPLWAQLLPSAGLDQVYAYLKYSKGGIVQRFVHQLKYNHQPYIGQALGQWYAEEIKEYLLQEGLEVIVPIPLHRSRKIRRGYNQSEMIGKGIKKVLNLPINTFSLRKHRLSRSQAKKNKIDRWEHMNELYYLIKPEALRGKNILLIDDVITTGATISGAVKILKSAGVHKVVVLCLATGK